MPSEWMPVLWGGEGPTFDDSAEARAITGAILQRYSAILRGLQAKPPRVDPLLTRRETGDEAADWSNGFRKAVAMRAAAWHPLLADKAGRAALLPVIALSRAEEPRVGEKCGG